MELRKDYAEKECRWTKVRCDLASSKNRICLRLSE